MASIVKGKVLKCEITDNMSQLWIGEHQGVFQSSGTMRLILDHQATIDFVKAVGIKKGSKKFSPFRLLSNKIEGKEIDIVFPQAPFMT